MIGRLYVSDELSIINVTWAPKITLLPHSHHTWAVIAVYEGREGNLFWRQCDFRLYFRSEGTQQFNSELEAGPGKEVAQRSRLMTP